MFGISSQEGYVYPNGIGADLVLSAVIGFFFMIPLGLVYYVFSIQMPRSGGDYIWLGRSLHPVLGFVGGWAMFISFVLLLASAMTTQAYVVIPDVAVSLGYAWNNPGLITWGQNFASSNVTVFATTMLAIVASVLIISLGPRVYSRIMIFMAGIIFLATFIFIGAYAAATPSSFASGLSAMTNGATTVNATISQASSSGSPFIPITWGATLFAVPFGVLLFNGFNYSAYVSGEVKNPKRSMLWGILIALAICGALDIFGIFAVVRAQTYPFAQAAFALGSAGKFSMGVSAPWAPLFMQAVLGNAYLVSLVGLGSSSSIFGGGQDSCWRRRDMYSHFRLTESSR
jgi:amino acid transporter